MLEFTSRGNSPENRKDFEKKKVFIENRRYVSLGVKNVVLICIVD